MFFSLQVEYDGITMEAAPIKPAVSQPALRTFSWVGTLGGTTRSLELDPQVYRLHVQLQQMVRDKEIFRTSGVIPPRLGSGSRQT